MVAVEPLDEDLAKLAGQALASRYRRSSAKIDARMTIDALVMASAARAGRVVYTADFDDLEMFAHFFPSVRLVGLSE